MTPQKQLEQILREIHVYFSKCEPCQDDGSRIRVEKNQVKDLLEKLDRSVYDLLERYDESQTNAEEGRRRGRREGDKLISQAESRAEDVYAASIIYTDDMIGSIRDIMDQTSDSLNDVIRNFRKDLRAQRELLQKHETELQSQLSDMADTRKYLKIIEDANREKEEKKKELARERENGREFARNLKAGEDPLFIPAVNPDIKVNPDYFAKSGKQWPDDEMVDFDISEPIPERADVRVNKDAAYFKWKEKQQEQIKKELESEKKQAKEDKPRVPEANAKIAQDPEPQTREPSSRKISAQQPEKKTGQKPEPVSAEKKEEDILMAEPVKRQPAAAAEPVKTEHRPVEDEQVPDRDADTSEKSGKNIKKAGSALKSAALKPFTMASEAVEKAAEETMRNAEEAEKQEKLKAADHDGQAKTEDTQVTGETRPLPDIEETVDWAKEDAARKKRQKREEELEKTRVMNPDTFRKDHQTQNTDAVGTEHSKELESEISTGQELPNEEALLQAMLRGEMELGNKTETGEHQTNAARDLSSETWSPQTKDGGGQQESGREMTRDLSRHQEPDSGQSRKPSTEKKQHKRGFKDLSEEYEDFDSENDPWAELKQSYTSDESVGEKLKDFLLGK